MAYAKDADEFVRHESRERTGWRRDEWAHGPLFICGKFRGVNTQETAAKDSDWNELTGERTLLSGVLK
jgi:hypothetical protein